jgi:hypothetical protein
MKSIIATFTLKDDFSNSVLILERDCDNIIKTVREKNPHLSTNKYPDKFSKNSIGRYAVKLIEL